MIKFQVYKNSILHRPDKSNKGSIDKPIASLINAINKQSSYCTTSSCSGRTVILKQPNSGKKNDVTFLFSTHGKITAAQVNKALAKLPKEQIWFRFEPLIIHIACDSIQSAEALLKRARTICKHSGILSTGNYPVIEIRGSEFVEAPIAEKKKLLISESYLKVLCAEANWKLKATQERIAVLNKNLESYL